MGSLVMSAQRHAESTSGNGAQQANALIETIPAITYIRRVGASEAITYVSPQVEAILGWSPRDYRAHPDYWLTLVHPQDRERVQAVVAEAIGNGTPLQVDYRVITPNGDTVWLRDTATRRGDTAGGDWWYGVQFDITDEKSAESQLQRLAFFDALTSLPNRRWCIDRLQLLLTQADRRIALLFIDLDRFKIINDGIGHAAGDELLVAVAERLAPLIDGRGSLARYGGDEFVAVLEHVQSQEEVEQIAASLVATLQRPFDLNGYQLTVDGTVGIALSNPDLVTPTDLLRAADVALYRAKKKGGGCFATFNPRFDRHGIQRLEQEVDLRRALERGEFQIVYQPIVDIATRQIQAVEALLRWNHPQRGLLMPADFIALAEETGLIVPLGRWVIEEACRQVHHWQNQFPTARQLRVSVNLSGRQLREAAVESDVARVLSQTGLSPESLALELKEGDALADATAIATTLKEFKRLGVKVTIDDFGKGWSALGSLIQFTIDDLKIHGSCVSQLGQQPQSADIVRALVSMAKAIGLDVTAAAVETSEQLTLLTALGCDRAQGRHFAPPLTVDEIEHLLRGEPALSVRGAATGRV
jgi:diguanylate cyclase (GGDEF)-like protein/PAS domain S-box-containing protein